ncbi:MAG TPA: Ig-like domain-containing protein [Nitrososphaeraceae archaeon]|nr:Ig-like domain-containing protein [Nitrososphaeraceae archaeon]
MVILFASVSLLFIPNLINMPITGQTDKSFKGTGAPFIPPSLSERLGLTSGNNFEFEDGDGEDEETDRDELPVLTKQEREEFLRDNLDSIESDRLTVSSKEIIDNATDPISSIVEEIVKNESIISDEESVPSSESSIIKFKDQNLRQLLDAQKVAAETENQTISTTENPPSNFTEEDYETEQTDKVSESQSPNLDVQSFINETSNEDTTPTSDNDTTVTTEEDVVEGKPSEILETDPGMKDEIKDIEQQMEESQQDEDQTTQDEGLRNTTPTTQDVSVFTLQNKQANIKLIANDEDGDPLSFTILDKPSNGQLGNVNPSTKTVIYTPDEDYAGEDNFTFIVSDGSTDSNQATVSVTIEEQQTEESQQEDEDDQTTQEQREESQQEDEDEGS